MFKRQSFSNSQMILWIFSVVFVTHSGVALADYISADEAAKSSNWQLVVKECLSDADAGEKNCQSHIGYAYKMGYGVERNLPLSVRYLKKCATQGQAFCEEMLGDSYKQGLGVDVDYQEALRLFKSAAQKGNPWAYNNLGNMYRLGQGVPTDLNEAAKNYRIASDKGNGAAQANLANLYRLGQGVERNGDTAFQLALKSSKLNFGAGWNMLGLLYRDGLGVRQDSAKAIESFKTAVSPSVKFPAFIAYSNLGAMYSNGMGVAIDTQEAVRWLEFGVKINQIESVNLLSTILAVGGKSVPADPSRAFSLAKQAYDKGSAEAANTLGWLYRDGVGTPKNLQLAVQYFTEARDKGVVAAYANLGRLLLEGQGVNKDAAKAHEYFLIARSQMNRLGKGNQKFIEDYFASTSADRKVVDPVKDTSTSSGTKPQVAVNSQALDANQQALIERLERLQKQIETLQASANTINESQAFQGQVQMANRRALVIGNDKYMHVSQLVNAREDASSIAKKLTQLGYKVSLHQDLTEKAFKQALREFRGTLDGGEEVLFYFAGHGVQLGAANYLLPTDTKGDNEDQVKDEAIELQRVLDDLKFKNSKFMLAIVDACRDNPFKQSGRAIGGRGLAPTTAATGQMVMFSAGAGQQALDKLGNSDKEKNGIFTRVLLKEMSKPGVPVDRVLKNVRNEVVRLSKSIGHEQTPALYDQAVGDFYFLIK